MTKCASCAPDPTADTGGRFRLEKGCTEWAMTNSSMVSRMTGQLMPSPAIHSRQSAPYWRSVMSRPKSGKRCCAADLRAQPSAQGSGQGSPQASWLSLCDKGFVPGDRGGAMHENVHDMLHMREQRQNTLCVGIPMDQCK